MSTEKEIICPHCKESFEDNKKEIQKCPHCGFLIDYDWVRTERELAKIGLEMGIARRHTINKTMPRKRFKPMPLKVGVTPEDGEEPTDESLRDSDEDLIFEHIPLSKRVNPKKRGAPRPSFSKKTTKLPKKRGALNGRKSK